MRKTEVLLPLLMIFLIAACSNEVSRPIDRDEVADNAVADEAPDLAADGWTQDEEAADTGTDIILPDEFPD